MKLTEKRIGELTDLDLDIANLFKKNEVDMDSSVLYLRLSGEIEEDCGAIILSASHEQMATSFYNALDDKMFKNCVFDAVVNYLGQEENVVELVTFMEYIDEIRVGIANK